jgi:hypothetical protein
LCNLGERLNVTTANNPEALEEHYENQDGFGADTVPATPAAVHFRSDEITKDRNSSTTDSDEGFLSES